MMSLVKSEAPLLFDTATDFAEELRLLLLAEGAGDLAVRVADLRIIARCRCGDEFCSTFYTASAKVPHGPGHRTIPLSPETGMINVDVVTGKIVCVEVLYRDDFRSKLHAALL
jgi:hypothetical protein